MHPANQASSFSGCGPFSGFLGVRGVEEERATIFFNYYYFVKRGTNEHERKVDRDRETEKLPNVD